MACCTTWIEFGRVGYGRGKTMTPNQLKKARKVFEEQVKYTTRLDIFWIEKDQTYRSSKTRIAWYAFLGNMK